MEYYNVYYYNLTLYNERVVSGRSFGVKPVPNCVCGSDERAAERLMT